MAAKKPPASVVGPRSQRREEAPSLSRRSPIPSAALDLSSLKKTHVLRLGLEGRKGHWVGHLVSAKPKDQQLTIKVKWMAEPRTVSFADIVSAEVRPAADKASRFAAVQLDA